MRTPIALTDQASARIVVLDVGCDWRRDPAVIWSWQPTVDGGDRDRGSWGMPNDVRCRTDATSGQHYVLVSDSCGLLARIAYPQGGPAAWSVDVGPGPNLHGIDLLPDGNVAAAASTGGWVRVYPASRQVDPGHYVEAPLVGAHQVLWDGALQTLWAVGDTHLVRYEVGGSTGEPTIRPERSYALPTQGGHDLQPLPGDVDRMWVTTVYGVYQFVKSQHRFVTSYPRRTDLYASNVKSIGTDPRAGTILQTTPKADDRRGWCTDQVDLFVGARTTVHKVLLHAEIYRARWFVAPANGEPNHDNATGQQPT